MRPTTGSDDRGATRIVAGEEDSAPLLLQRAEARQLAVLIEHLLAPETLADPVAVRAAAARALRQLELVDATSRALEQGRSPPAQRPRSYRLTRREMEVASLLRLRRSNAEIARTLGISGHTARHHTESVLAKLGLHSRTEVDERFVETPATRSK